MDPAMAKALRRNALLLAFANIVTALALLFGDPGSSSALAFLKLVMPLPLWGGLFLVAASLLAAGEYVFGHTVAAVTNLMLATGSALGLLSGATRSSAGSLLFVGMAIAVAGLHVNGMVFRRREALRRSK